MAQDPTDRVHDEFRMKDVGGVQAPFNSKCATSNFYVDRSRLRVDHCEEYIPGKTPNDMGRFVRKDRTASIMDNARDAAGGMGARSSFQNVHEPKEKSNHFSTPFGYAGNNPLTKLRGDE